METLAAMVTYLISMCILTKYLKKATTKEMDAYIEEKNKLCVLHGDELKELKKTTRLMLECHDTTLKSLDAIAHGETPNGDIADQRIKLKDYLLDKSTQ